MKKAMSISLISAILIIAGSLLLILSTFPVGNTLEDNTLTIKFVIGEKKIDMTDAHYYPVPEDTTHNIIRVGGTSIGKKQVGNFMNTKTRTKYKFYLTGKGEKVYFEIGKDKYLVDGISEK